MGADVSIGASGVTLECVKCFLQGGSTFAVVQGGWPPFLALFGAPAQITCFQKMLDSRAVVGHAFDLT